jgi:nucleotidyltransferase/DNA polymerase involved in DNA repair
MPSTIAMPKCSELVFVPARFDVYRDVSNQIHTIFKDYTPLVEPLSLDEAYLDVTDNLKGIPTAWETARKSGRASTRKSGSQPRPEFPATSSSPNPRPNPVRIPAAERRSTVGVALSNFQSQSGSEVAELPFREV